MLQRHSAIFHAAYHDLRRLLLDEAVSDLRGTPTKVTRGARSYWYDTYRVGSDVRKTYIGEDSPALRDRIDRHKDLKAASAERRKDRTRLVRLLRAEGAMGTDPTTGSLISAFANAGVFRLGGTLVGTHAFRLYEGELALRLTTDQAAMTADIDVASFERLSLALSDTVAKPLQDVLTDFQFAPVPGLDRGKTWRWRQSSGEALVEFLTPSFDETESVAPLAALGVDAQALHHLNFILRDPIQAVLLYRGGVLVQVPTPERFALHKLIVADRRKGSDAALKSEKDRRQAALLIDYLVEDRPDEMAEALIEAQGEGPRWRERLVASLARLPKTREKLDSVRTQFASTLLR